MAAVSYLVSVGITALSEPQAQEFFVNAFRLLVLSMPDIIGLLDPISACSIHLIRIGVEVMVRL